MKTTLTTAAVLAATLCATAAAQSDRTLAPPLPAQALQEIAYEFRFAYGPGEVGTDALRTRLRVEASDYCEDATREADLSDYAGQCARVVTDAVEGRLAALSAGPRLASND